jgi:hypothetical protein
VGNKGGEHAARWGLVPMAAPPRHNEGVEGGGHARGRCESYIFATNLVECLKPGDFVLETGCQTNFIQHKVLRSLQGKGVNVRKGRHQPVRYVRGVGSIRVHMRNVAPVDVYIPEVGAWLAFTATDSPVPALIGTDTFNAHRFIFDFGKQQIQIRSVPIPCQSLPVCIVTLCCLRDEGRAVKPYALVSPDHVDRDCNVRESSETMCVRTCAEGRCFTWDQFKAFAAVCDSMTSDRVAPVLTTLPMTVVASDLALPIENAESEDEVGDVHESPAGARAGAISPDCAEESVRSADAPYEGVTAAPLIGVNTITVDQHEKVPEELVKLIVKIHRKLQCTHDTDTIVQRLRCDPLATALKPTQVAKIVFDTIARCEWCPEKRAAPRHQNVRGRIRSRIGETVLMDLNFFPADADPILCLLDMFSHLAKTKQLKGKTEEDLIEGFKDLWLEANMPKLENLLSDNESALGGNLMKFFLAANSILVNKTVPYTPQQIGLIECLGSHIVKEAIILKKQLSITKQQALRMATSMFNTTHNQNKITPQQFLNGTTGDADHDSTWEGFMPGDKTTVYHRQCANREGMRERIIDAQNKHFLTTCKNTRSQMPKPWLKPGAIVRFKQGSVWHGPAEVIYVSEKANKVWLDNGGDHVRATWDSCVPVHDDNLTRVVNSVNCEDIWPELKENPTTPKAYKISICDICQHHCGNEYNLRTHKKAKHGVLPPLMLTESVKSSDLVDTVQEVGTANFRLEHCADVEEFNTKMWQTNQKQMEAIAERYGIGGTTDRDILMNALKSKWALLVNNVTKMPQRPPTKADIAIRAHQERRQVPELSAQAKRDEIARMEHNAIRPVRSDPDDTTPILTTLWNWEVKERDAVGLPTVVKERCVIQGQREPWQHLLDCSAPTVEYTMNSVFYQTILQKRLETIKRDPRSTAWMLRVDDVERAFHQSDPLERRIRIKPPPEAHVEKGILWEVIVGADGLKSSPNLWFWTFVRACEACGGRVLSWSPCVILYFGDHGSLQGLLKFHVDNLDFAGNKHFDDEFLRRLYARFRFKGTQFLLQPTPVMGVTMQWCEDDQGVHLCFSGFESITRLQQIPMPAQCLLPEALDGPTLSLVRGQIGKLTAMRKTHWLLSGALVQLSCGLAGQPTWQLVTELNVVIEHVLRTSQLGVVMHGVDTGCQDFWEGGVIFGESDASFQTLPRAGSQAGHVVLFGKVMDLQPKRVEERCALFGERWSPQTTSAHRISQVATSTHATELLSTCELAQQVIMYKEAWFECTRKTVISAMGGDMKGVFDSLMFNKTIEAKLALRSLWMMRNLLSSGQLDLVVRIPRAMLVADVLSNPRWSMERFVREVAMQGVCKFVVDLEVYGRNFGHYIWNARSCMLKPVMGSPKDFRRVGWGDQ